MLSLFSRYKHFPFAEPFLKSTNRMIERRKGYKKYHQWADRDNFGIGDASDYFEKILIVLMSICKLRHSHE